MGNFNLIDPKREFMVVEHNHLNNTSLDIENAVNKTLSLQKIVGKRKIVCCLEGDLVQIGRKGEIVLTHRTHIPLLRIRYNQLKRRGIAADFDEFLRKLNSYMKKSSKRVILCLELKNITSKNTIKEVIRKLKEYRIKDVYFDSFIGKKLEIVEKNNQEQKTNYLKSFHLIMNLNDHKITFRVKKDYDILTVPKIFSFGRLSEPVIYGSVTTKEQLHELAKDKKVYGAYVRFSERNLLKLFWNSIWVKSREYP
ncbi:MAG: hypothetical protein AABY22_13935 [Nanoarchaeota archaeon]